MVRVPVPTLTSEPPTPPNSPPSWMVPLTVVERLLDPTVSCEEPRKYVPAPAIEPAVIGTLGRPSSEPSGKVPRPDMSKTPFALVMNSALPPVLLPKNLVSPPSFVVIVALPALLPWKKFVFPLLVMLALPAVAVPPPKKPGAKLSSANWLTVIVAFSALLVPVKKMNPLVSAPIGRVGRPAMSVALPA